MTGCNLLFLPTNIILLNHWKVSTRHVIQNEWNTTEHFVRSGPKTKTDFCIEICSAPQSVASSNYDIKCFEFISPRFERRALESLEITLCPR